MSDILEKLKKLLAHQRSAEKIGSQAEAAAFAAKVQELLFANKLSMNEIDVQEQERDEPIEKQYVSAADLGFARLRQRVEWMEDLANAVARNFFCRILVVEGSNTIVFVGRETDRQAVIQMFGHLAQMATELAADELTRWKNGGGMEIESDDSFNDYGELRSDAVRSRIFKRSFLRGFVSAISTRLRENRKDLEDNAGQSAKTEEGNTGSALVLIGRQEEAIAAYMKSPEINGKAATCLGGSTHNSQGYSRGRARGSSVSLESRARIGA